MPILRRRDQSMPGARHQLFNTSVVDVQGVPVVAAGLASEEVDHGVSVPVLCCVNEGGLLCCVCVA